MDGTFPWLTVLTTKSVVNFHHPVTAHSGQTVKTSGNLIIATCFNQFSFYGFTPTIDTEQKFKNIYNTIICLYIDKIMPKNKKIQTYVRTGEQNILLHPEN